MDFQYHRSMNRAETSLGKAQAKCKTDSPGTRTVTSNALRMLEGEKDR